MESTLNNLQKIEDFRVVSRTSAETYSKSDLSIPEIAEELNVNYVVEGSGQRVGDQVLLNIQLKRNILWLILKCETIKNIIHKST